MDKVFESIISSAIKHKQVEKLLKLYSANGGICLKCNKECGEGEGATPYLCNYCRESLEMVSGWGNVENKG